LPLAPVTVLVLFEVDKLVAWSKVDGALVVSVLVGVALRLVSVLVLVSEVEVVVGSVEVWLVVFSLGVVIELLFDGRAEVITSVLLLMGP